MNIRLRTRFGRAIRGTSGLILLLLVAGCSTFEREWKQAASSEESGLAGRWQGTWSSDVNGHHGGLRCIVSPAKGNEYRARFRASYQAVLHFTYTADLHAQQADSVFQFQGEADLGLAGGVYHYVGHADRSNFVSTYACSSDRGTFQMTRPKARQ